MATSKCEICHSGGPWRFVVVYDAILAIVCANCGHRRVYERHYDQARKRPEGTERGDDLARNSADTLRKYLEERYE